MQRSVIQTTTARIESKKAKIDPIFFDRKPWQVQGFFVCDKKSTKKVLKNLTKEYKKNIIDYFTFFKTKYEQKNLPCSDESRRRSESITKKIDCYIANGLRPRASTTDRNKEVEIARPWNGEVQKNLSRTDPACERVVRFIYYQLEMIGYISNIVGLRETSKTELFLVGTRYLIASFIFLSFYDEQLAYEIIIGHSSVSIVTLYVCMSLVVFNKEIAMFLVALRRTYKESVCEQVDNRIDGVNVSDLIKHLVENCGLPTQKTKDMFDVQNEWVKKLWDNLERVGILKRWENNARVLATDDVDVLLATLIWSEDSDTLTPPLLQVSRSEYEVRKP